MKYLLSKLAGSMGGKLFLLPAVGDGVFLPNQDEETFMSLFSVSKGLSTCNVLI